MKKVLLVGLALAMAGSSFAAPAAAGKKKKPVATELFLHGDAPLGEIDTAQNQVPGTYRSMDPKKPEGSQSKSQFIINYGVGPNDRCAGNNLFPVWVGNVAGTVKGDMKLSLTAASLPGKVVVRVWPDVAAIACNENYIEPVAQVTVDLAPGQGVVEAVLEDVNFKAVSSLMVQISPATTDVNGTPRPLPPVVSRIFYDSSSAPSSLSFLCIPAKGKTCAG